MTEPDASPLAIRAARAVHRANDDSFAELFSEMSILPIHEYPNASKWAGKRDSGAMRIRLWKWACKRWKDFPVIEYRVRVGEQPPRNP